MRITNDKNIPLSLAVWLARDTYDYQSDDNYFSATTLIKSPKQVVLSKRVPRENQVVDVHDLVPSRIGTAIHDSIEMAWVNNYQQALEQLGHEDIAHRVRINWDPDSLEKGLIPVFMEQRAIKQLGDFKIGGKFDMVFNGTLIDFKSTSTFTYINKVNDAKYQLQGSIYRWLNPDLIMDDFMEIHYIFTDWKKGLADQQKDYPPARAMTYRIPLLSLEETEAYINKRLDEYRNNQHLPEESLPPCNDKDLWRRESVWKYYRDLSKTARSTKNFDNPSDAHSHALSLSSKNPTGGVIEVKGEVVACKFCDAFSICKQKDTYILSGELKSI